MAHHTCVDSTSGRVSPFFCCTIITTRYRATGSECNGILIVFFVISFCTSLDLCAYGRLVLPFCMIFTLDFLLCNTHTTRTQIHIQYFRDSHRRNLIPQRGKAHSREFFYFYICEQSIMIHYLFPDHFLRPVAAAVVRRCSSPLVPIPQIAPRPLDGSRCNFEVLPLADPSCAA